ncbi:MAG TPA: HIT domain-containing protein [Mycobacteriales bacterium]
MSSLDVPRAEPCAFCEYLAGRLPYTVLRRGELTATLVTREQRGVAHVLVIPVAHRETVLDLTDDEAAALLPEVRAAAAAIERAESPRGIAVWQNNGVPAHQTVPHVHVHVTGTFPGGGTKWGLVPRLAVEETDRIGARLRPFFDAPPR